MTLRSPPEHMVMHQYSTIVSLRDPESPIPATYIKDPLGAQLCKELLELRDGIHLKKYLYDQITDSGLPIFYGPLDRVLFLAQEYFDIQEDSAPNDRVEQVGKAISELQQECHYILENWYSPTSATNNPASFDYIQVGFSQLAEALIGSVSRRAARNAGRSARNVQRMYGKNACLDKMEAGSIPNSLEGEAILTSTRILVINVRLKVFSQDQPGTQQQNCLIRTVRIRCSVNASVDFLCTTLETTFAGFSACVYLVSEGELQDVVTGRTCQNQELDSLLSGPKIEPIRHECATLDQAVFSTLKISTAGIYYIKVVVIQLREGDFDVIQVMYSGPVDLRFLAEGSNSETHETFHVLE